MKFLVGVLVGLLVSVACGHIGQFPYKFYNIFLPPECYRDGKLIGKDGRDGWPDIPLTTCQPDEGNKMKCTLALTPDFYDAKGAFLKCEQDLHNCQKHCKLE